MRIYNAKDSQVSIPLTQGGEKIVVAPHSVSGSFLPNQYFLSLLVTSFDYDELALIVSGPYEINMCSTTACCAGFVVNSLEEAIDRFTKSEEAPTPSNQALIKDPIEEASKKAETLKDEEKPEAETGTKTRVRRKSTKK